MDPPTMVKTCKYSSSMAQPMFSVLEPPSIHYGSSTQNHHHHHSTTTHEDISFTSYLKSSQKPQENPINDDTEISIFDAQKYFSESNDPKDMKTNQPSPDTPSVPRLSSVSSVDGYGLKYRSRSFRATPTASSEASWNSQTGLLTNPPGSVGVSLRNFPSGDGKKTSSITKKWIFGQKCCCNGKKSVQVKEIITSNSELVAQVKDANYLYARRDSNSNSSRAKLAAPPPPPSVMSQRSSITSNTQHDQKVIMSPNHSYQKNDQDGPRQQRVSASGGFSFPILDPTTQGNKPVLKEIKTKQVINPLEDPPRDSLEVFQPMNELPSASMPVPLDINPVRGRQHHFNPGSPVARDDDAVSDASSDLFEIESFSTQTTSYPMYRRRDSLDDAPAFNARRFAVSNGINLNNDNNSSNKIEYGRRSLDEMPTPSVAATECYAPSEVSIDWSVTTAEGFDKASVSNFSVSASEFGTAAFLRQQAAGGGGGKRKGNSGGGLLLMSCRQEKAVSVGPQPVKCVAAEGAGHVGGRPPRANKPPPPLGSEHSARLSLAFAA